MRQYIKVSSVTLALPPRCVLSRECLRESNRAAQHCCQILLDTPGSSASDLELLMIVVVVVTMVVAVLVLIIFLLGAFLCDLLAIAIDELLERLE
jgi:hypothetical protein